VILAPIEIAPAETFCLLLLRKPDPEPPRILIVLRNADPDGSIVFFVQVKVATTSSRRCPALVGSIETPLLCERTSPTTVHSRLPPPLSRRNRPGISFRSRAPELEQFSFTLLITFPKAKALVDQTAAEGVSLVPDPFDSYQSSRKSTPLEKSPHNSDTPHLKPPG